MNVYVRHLYRLFLISAAVLLAVLMIYVTLYLTIYAAFEKLEKKQAMDAMERCEAAINSEITRISAMCHDWGMWDDAYNFIKDKNPSFVTTNLTNSLFENNQLNMISFARIDGEIVFSSPFDLESKENFELNDMSNGKVQGNFQKLLRLQSPDARLSGFIDTEKGPFMVVSNPVLTSQGQGPILGVIIMGRIIDKKFIRNLSEKTGIDIKILSLSGKEEPLMAGNKYVLQEISSDFLKVEWTVNDINGKPCFVLSIELRRDVTKNGMAVIWMAMLVIIGLGVIMTVMTILFLGEKEISAGSYKHGVRGSHVMVIIVILVFGISLSVFTYHVFKKNERDRLFNDFERDEAVPVATLLEHKFLSLEESIDSIIRLFETDEDVTRDEFRRFTAKILERNTDIRALDWVPRVLRSERAEYENKASEELKKEYFFTVKTPDGKMIKTAERDEYFPVYYYEPRAGNQESAGLDNYSEATRKAMLDKSRMTGQRILAVNLKLVQDKQKRPGFLLFNPVYKMDSPVNTPERRWESIKGFVVMVFHIDDIIQTMFLEGNLKNMSLEIFDEGGENRTLLYSNERDNFVPGTGKEVIRKFDFGGRKLVIACSPTEKYVLGHTSKVPYYVMSIGLLITMVLGLLVYARIQGTLKEGEKQYRQLFEEMMSGFAMHEIICDENGIPVDYRFLAVNEEFEKLTGLKAKNIDRRRVLDVLPSTEKYWIEKYGKVALTGEPAQFEEYSSALGKYYEVRAFSPEKGKFATIFHDITDRKKNEATLLNAAREWRATFDAVSDAVWLLDTEQRIIRCNKATLAFTGKEFKDILGKHCWEIIHGTKEPLPECPITRMNKTKQNETQEIRIGNKWYLVKVDPILDEKGEIAGAVHIVSDITVRKLSEEEKLKLEEQLHQAQKMESIGRLAGGVAHDFNNLLTPILGYVEILKMDIPKLDPRREKLEQIKGAAERAKDLTRQLLAFGRKQMLDLKDVNLVLVINKLGKMLRRTIREDVRIVFELQKDAGFIKADIGQIEQILLNLSVNAQDAMIKGGELKIKLENSKLSAEDLVEDPDIMPGDYVCLSVSDTGHGMDESVLEHLFEPFFTTKEMGKGTGLGLSTVYGIVKQHSGHIQVFSELGKGTTFKIYLPLVIPQSEVQEEPPVAPSKIREGGETILVVEDNEMVRNITALLLNNFGYRVISFDKGEECILFVEKNTDHVDLLLTDVIMPSINGKEVYERVRKKRPGIKVLYMSGYDKNLVSLHGVIGTGLHFLPKPFTAESLAEKVREALDS